MKASPISQAQGFSYLVTLVGGAFAITHNGVELDRLIVDRWRDVRSIEVLANNDKRIATPVEK